MGRPVLSSDETDCTAEGRPRGSHRSSDPDTIAEETIVLSTCLIASPLTCKDIHIQVAPDQGASLQLPFHCARQGQIEVQKWIADHPGWKVEKWSCPPNGRIGHKT